MYDDSSDTWTLLQPTGDIPVPRLHHTLIDVDSRTLLLYGGFNNFQAQPNHHAYGDLYLLDLPTLVWKRLDTLITGVQPSPRGAQGAVFVDGVFYMFGGFPKILPTGQLRELWQFTIATLTWVNLTPSDPSVPFPAGRIGFAWSLVNREAFMFGGSCTPDASSYSNGQCSDDWKYDVQANTWTQLFPKGNPLPRRAGNADASVYGIVYLFGGVYIQGTNVTMYNDLQAYDPVNDVWSSVHPNYDRPPRPPTSFGHSVVHINKKIVIFGGRVGAPTSPGSNQVWEFNALPAL